MKTSVTSQVEKLIRQETGIGPLTTSHIVWLQTLIKVAFHSKSSGVVYYREGRTSYLYLFPTDEPDEAQAKNSLPIDFEKYTQQLPAAQKMLKLMLDKSEFFVALRPYYKLKIVRTVPKKVRESENLKWQ